MAVILNWNTLVSLKNNFERSRITYILTSSDALFSLTNGLLNWPLLVQLSSICRIFHNVNPCQRGTYLHFGLNQRHRLQGRSAFVDQRSTTSTTSIVLLVKLEAIKMTSYKIANLGAIYNVDHWKNTHFKKIKKAPKYFFTYL